MSFGFDRGLKISNYAATRPQAGAVPHSVAGPRMELGLADGHGGLDSLPPHLRGRYPVRQLPLNTSEVTPCGGEPFL